MGLKRFEGYLRIGGKILNFNKNKTLHNLNPVYLSDLKP
jgi:hypothetical protein